MKRRDRAGFTLAELLIVVAIISVLVAIAIPVFSSSRDKAVEATCLANRRSAYAVQRVAVMSGDLKADATSDQVMDYVGSAIVCPGGGTISFDTATGNFVCSLHSGDGETGGDSGGGTDPTPEAPGGGGTGNVDYDFLVTNSRSWPKQGEAGEFKVGQIVSDESGVYVLVDNITITNEYNWSSLSDKADSYQAIQVTSSTAIYQQGSVTSGEDHMAFGSIMQTSNGDLYIFKTSSDWWLEPPDANWVKISV